MSIIRNGIQLATTGTVDYEQLQNKPSINGTVLTGNVTIDATNILTVASLPTSDIDQTKLYKQGSTLNWYNGSAWVTLSASQSYVAGTGISIASDGTINHSNSVSSGTSGSSTAIPQITFDAQGHITAVTPITVYPPTTVGTSGQYWKSDGSGTGAWQTAGAVEENNANLVTGGTVWKYIQDNAGGGGGASVTLNGTATTSASFYAPTVAGTAKTILVSKGENIAPQYTPHASIDDNSSDTIDQQAFTTLTLGNSNAQSSGDDHSEGRIIINSAGTGAHRLVGAESSSTYVNTLPNSAGLLVSNGKTDGTAVGSSSVPVYINESGVATSGGDVFIKAMFDMMHPIGSVYIGMAGATAPQVTLTDGSTKYGTWTKMKAGYWLVSDGTGDATSVTQGSVSAGLPNIYGRTTIIDVGINSSSWLSGNGTSAPFVKSNFWNGIYSTTSSGMPDGYGQGYFDASKANSIYGNSSTVQPQSYKCQMWFRTA